MKLHPETWSSTSRKLVPVLGALVAMLNCGDTEASRRAGGGNSIAFEEFHFPTVNPVALKLTVLDTITMGSDSTIAVAGARRLLIREGKLYVLDASSRLVGVFDSTGVMVEVIGGPGRGPGEFQDPMDITFIGESLLVIDPTIGKGASIFVGDSFVGFQAYDLPRMPTAVTAYNGNLYFVTGAIQNPETEGDGIVTAVTSDGHAIGRGCPLDPRFVESRRKSGMIALIQSAAIAARDGRIFCVQPLSPVVQILDSRLVPRSKIALAPPFYEPPSDKPASSNQLDILDFFAEWTAHVGFFPFDGGFASVYTRYDKNAEESQFDLFLCGDAHPRRCGTVRLPGQPLAMFGVDSLFVIGDFGPSEATRLIRLGVSGL